VDMPKPEDFKALPYTYSEEHFLEYAVEFHKLLKDHMSNDHTSNQDEWDSYIASNINLYPYTDKEYGTRYKTWSMLDPIETWGQYPEGIFKRVHRNEIALCWTAYLDHEIHFSNRFRRGNNWIPVFNSTLSRRLLNQITIVPATRNNYDKDKWAKYVSI